MHDDREIEARDKVLTLLAEIGHSLASGTRHYKKSDGSLLESKVDMLRALRDEKVIEIEPIGSKEKVGWPR